LVGVPDRGAFPSVEVPGPGMAELPTIESDGLIWLIPDMAGELTKAPDLGPIGDDFKTFNISDHYHWRTHRFNLPINWKLVIDTFLEPYHFAALHKNTVGPLFFPNLCYADRHGPHVREVLPRRSLAELAEQEPSSWDLIPHSALVYVLFPGTVLVMQIDHIETWRTRPDPTDPAKSICDLDFYIPNGPMTDSALRHWERNWKLTIDTVIDEDFEAMAGAQRGLSARGITQMRFGANEPALAMFHTSLSEALAALA